MEQNTDENETALINAAVGGERRALEQLIEKHRDWIFNVALSFVADRDDAADVTQEVLIRIVTKLSTFRHESDFRTWVYRIVKNHFLNMKRRKYEAQTMTFDVFAKGLDSIADETLHAHAYEVEEKMLVEEANLAA
ncbi:MAG: RNA polymerase sigma factor [Bacteroidia bacterium]|nr:RNA polymerase sigma factor [Bacteroidia bacterium]